MKKLLLFTDTSKTQINGVTRCLDNLIAHLPENIDVTVVSSDDFITIPFIGYKEIRLTLTIPRQIYARIRDIEPDMIHIMTEGPLGLMAAAVCKKHEIPYTTTFHTKFPEYLALRNRLIKEDYIHQYLHYIHDGAETIFVSNAGMQEYLESHDYRDISIVPLGIDHEQFFPAQDPLLPLHPTKTTILFVGRLAIEKNIEDFLKISDMYHKVVIGDGPLRAELEEAYQTTEFVGVKTGTELREMYQRADVFVFPSKTDTLGLVNLEAMACGKPVVAYDMDITRGIIQDGINGILVSMGRSLESGIDKALSLDPIASIATARQFTWSGYVDSFLAHQSQIPSQLWTSHNT